MGVMDVVFHFPPVRRQRLEPLVLSHSSTAPVSPPPPLVELVVVMSGAVARA